MPRRSIRLWKLAKIVFRLGRILGLNLAQGRLPKLLRLRVRDVDPAGTSCRIVGQLLGDDDDRLRVRLERSRLAGHRIPELTCSFLKRDLGSRDCNAVDTCHSGTGGTGRTVFGDLF